MESTEQRENNEKPFTLSVDVEPFIPRQQNQSSNENLAASLSDCQHVQGIPSYITSCYPFVQEECVNYDYKNAPWSTYTPNSSLQLSFQYSAHQVPSGGQGIHQTYSYSRYPQVQLSPRYKRGCHSRFKQDQLPSWDGLHMNKNWSGLKLEGSSSYLDLQQQEFHLRQQAENLYHPTSQDFNSSPRTFRNKGKINYRKENNAVKDISKEGSVSETSSSDLSSQSSSRSHARTFGDFFSHMKTVKRSKSLPNSAAKLESPRGKVSNSTTSGMKIPVGSNRCGLEPCSTDWPSPSPSVSNDKVFKNIPICDPSQTKPRSFADIIKAKPTENKSNSVGHIPCVWSTGSSEPYKGGGCGTNDDVQVMESFKPSQKYRTKMTQYIQQPKYYTDISPRCTINSVLPEVEQNNSDTRSSASCSDIRALRTPRLEPNHPRRRVTGKCLAEEIKHQQSSKPLTTDDGFDRQNGTSQPADDKKKWSKYKRGQMPKVSSGGHLGNQVTGGGSSYIDVTSVVRRDSDPVRCIRDPIQHETGIVDHKGGTWRYLTAQSVANAEIQIGKNMKRLDRNPKSNKIKTGDVKHTLRMAKSHSLEKTNVKSDNVDLSVALEKNIDTKLKKKKSATEKTVSRKTQLAAVQGKMVLLTPEDYSKWFHTSSSEECNNATVKGRLDNEDDYPQLGSLPIPKKERESQIRLGRGNTSGNEDEEWSDIESDFEFEGFSPGRSVTGQVHSNVQLLNSNDSNNNAESKLTPLSYSAAVKQPKIESSPREATSGQLSADENNAVLGEKKMKSSKKKCSRPNEIKVECNATKSKPPKPKRNAPIQLNISQMLTDFEKKKKSKKSKASFSVSNRGLTKDSRSSKIFPVIANILDSTAPMRRRGKEREVPAKKHPSALKKIILREREQRKKLRLQEEEKRKRLISGSSTSDVEAQDSAWETQGSNSSAAASVCGGPEEEQNFCAGPTTSVAKSALHSRRFREYCYHTLNPEIDLVVTRLLQDLIRFHTRLYHKDPIKAKSRRRIVLGLREVTKHLKLKRLKCVILAPNLDRIKSKGGLDDAIDTILSLAKDQNVPCVFALGRKPLGKVCYKQVPVSCVGIFNYSGSESNFSQLMELVAQAREEYQQMLDLMENGVESGTEGAQGCNNGQVNSVTSIQ